MNQTCLRFSLGLSLVCLFAVGARAQDYSSPGGGGMDFSSPPAGGGMDVTSSSAIFSSSGNGMGVAMEAAAFAIASSSGGPNALAGALMGLSLNNGNMGLALAAAGALMDGTSARSEGGRLFSSGGRGQPLAGQAEFDRFVRLQGDSAISIQPGVLAYVRALVALTIEAAEASERADDGAAADRVELVRRAAIALMQINADARVQIGDPALEDEDAKAAVLMQTGLNLTEAIAASSPAALEQLRQAVVLANSGAIRGIASSHAAALRQGSRALRSNAWFAGLVIGMASMVLMPDMLIDAIWRVSPYDWVYAHLIGPPPRLFSSIGYDLGRVIIGNLMPGPIAGALVGGGIAAIDRMRARFKGLVRAAVVRRAWPTTPFVRGLARPTVSCAAFAG